MPKRKTYTPDLMPEESVPKALSEKGLLKDGGYACRDCDYVTKKKGFPGRQALRAHNKKHQRERRAWRGPFVRQMVIVLVVVALVAVRWDGIGVSPELPISLPLVTLPQSITAWATFGAATAALGVGLVALLAGMVSLSEELGDKVLARTLDVMSIVALAFGLWLGVGAWELVSPSLSWVMQTPLWAIVALSPAMAAVAGRLRLLVRRRKVRSGSYFALLVPKDREAAFSIRMWLGRKSGGRGRPRGQGAGTLMSQNLREHMQ